MGAGPLNFGMSVAEVRTALSSSPETFHRGPASAFPVDHYVELGVFAYYKLPGVLEAIEFAARSCPVLFGQSIFQLTPTELLGLLRQHDSNLELDAGGATSRALGVGFAVEENEETGAEQLQSFIVFEDGYYD